MNIINWIRTKILRQTLAVAIDKHGLKQRSREELLQMLAMHSAKLPRVQRQLYLLQKYPDSLRCQMEDERLSLEDQGLQGLTDTAINNEVQSQISFYKAKVSKLQEIVTAIEQEQIRPL